MLLRVHCVATGTLSPDPGDVASGQFGERPLVKTWRPFCFIGIRLLLFDRVYTEWFKKSLSNTSMKLTLLLAVILSIFTTIKADEHDHRVNIIKLIHYYNLYDSNRL